MGLYSEEDFSFGAAYGSGWGELERILVGIDGVRPIPQKFWFSFLIRKWFPDISPEHPHLFTHWQVMDNIRLATPDRCTLSVSYDGMQPTFQASGQIVIGVAGMTFNPIPIQLGDFAFEFRGWASGVMNEIAIKSRLVAREVSPWALETGARHPSHLRWR
jgi:hypothetical protein